MYLFENPVLQRELLVNLRMKRSFALLLLYQAILATVVYFAWPRAERLTANAAEARALVNMFFLGQYVLASLMAPSFAAATITGEKERKTYEMLLASPLKPSAICWGKLLSSLAHIGLLIFASLPIVMLCLPLGGVSIYEVFAAYWGLFVSVLSFGMISIACSSYFQRTASALVASYLLILPLALMAVMIWISLEDQGQLRLWLTTIWAPIVAAVICIPLFRLTAQRLLHPPDVGSEGKDVIDLEREAQDAVGLVIRRDQFPDNLIAPPRRETLMQDGANPIYDKEIHSELFAQGTLMLRLVIQISMILAIPIMAVTLFFSPVLAAWYISYVIMFNMLVGPVFSAGSITGERERQTLDLLLTTTITPWQIIWGKLLAGLRVSSVLTLFLVWPLFLAVIFNDYYHRKNVLAVLAYVVIMVLTCVSTALIAQFCSVLFQRTTTSLMTTYAVILMLFCVPLALTMFVRTFMNNSELFPLASAVHWSGITSPFAAAVSVPLTADEAFADSRWALSEGAYFPDSWQLVLAHISWAIGLNVSLFTLMIFLFHHRWRVAQ